MYVRTWHRPWPAALLLTALLTFIERQANRLTVHLLLHGLIFLALSGFLFWAIDRSPNLILTLALAAAGAAVCGLIV